MNVEARGSFSQLLTPQDTFSERSTTPKVWVHTGNFLPWSAVVSNTTLRQWVEETGADKMEWIAVGKGPIGPTHEVLVKPVAALQKIFGEHLGGGHVIFNPYATMWNIIGRQEDPLRPGEPIVMYNVLLATEKKSYEALRKLNAVQKGKFSIVGYPPLRGQEIFGGYPASTMRYQTHPRFYGDQRSAEQIVKDIHEKRINASSVCVDLYHMQEETPDHVYPFGTTEDELKRSIEILHNAGLLGEIHFQPLEGREVSRDKTVLKEDDLTLMFGENPSYDTRTGKILKFALHELGFMGPYTVEMDPRSLMKVYGPKILLPPHVGPMLEAQAAVVDYIRRA